MGNHQGHGPLAYEQQPEPAARDVMINVGLSTMSETHSSSLPGQLVSSRLSTVFLETRGTKEAVLLYALTTVYAVTTSCPRWLFQPLSDGSHFRSVVCPGLERRAFCVQTNNFHGTSSTLSVSRHFPRPRVRISPRNPQEQPDRNGRWSASYVIR